jgi:histidyl-tRNA synthetase
MSTLSLRPDDVVKRANAIGSYYGFTALAHAAAEKKSSSKSPYPENFVLEGLDPAAREVAGFLKHVRDAGLEPSTLNPLFLWHTNAAAGRPAPKQIIIQFHVLGVDHAIADAVLIRTIRSLITELTKEDPRLRLNSMGDKETRSRFARELGVFFRKQSATLPEDCVTRAKTGELFEAAEMVAGCAARDELPSPTDHLSEASRKHFEGVLEYLEATDMSYELAPDLLSRGSAWGETVFEVISNDKISAWGSRYSEFTRPFFKSAVPSVGAVLRFTPSVKTEIPVLKEQGKSRFVFVHIGDEAKRESMKMTDTLRRAHISMTQAIGIQSLTQQMHFAEKMNPPYLIIMGRKEALERSVIIRERSSHTETFVSLDNLVERLKAVS